MMNGDSDHEPVAPRTSLDDGKDGIFRDNENPHRHSPGVTAKGIANFQQRHDFWHTLAGIAGNVLEWYVVVAWRRNRRMEMDGW